MNRNPSFLDAGAEYTSDGFRRTAGLYCILRYFNERCPAAKVCAGEQAQVQPHELE